MGNRSSFERTYQHDIPILNPEHCYWKVEIPLIDEWNGIGHEYWSGPCDAKQRKWTIYDLKGGEPDIHFVQDQQKMIMLSTSASSAWQNEAIRVMQENQDRNRQEDDMTLGMPR